VKRLFAVVLLALFALAAPASAQTFPQLTGRVVDQADILRPEQELDLSTKSETLQAQTGRQFVVATVKSLEGRPIEDYAYQLGRHWGIGQKEEDDGVILLVAPNERKVWIATGYGAGAFLTDAVSGVIIREAILPQFKKSPPDYGAGITAGADAIIKQMSLPPEEAQANVAKARKQESARHEAGAGFLPVLFILIVLFILFSSFARRHSGRRYRRRRGGIDPFVVLWGLNELSRSRGRGGWGGGGLGGSSWGGGGGGGFGGFSGGGGSFGGGGAGGSW
jgi:uncharacterized protein